ncbi:MAG: hypothetical protein MUQ10_13230, partial [Anaerolineae bacterium]|nr:hypothetical protein [Anaerolineae bacterium]
TVPTPHPLCINLRNHCQPLLFFHCQYHSRVHGVTFSLNTHLVTNSLNNNTTRAGFLSLFSFHATLLDWHAVVD